MASNGTSLPLRNDLKTPLLNRADEVDDVSHEFSAVELPKQINRNLFEDPSLTFRSSFKPFNL
jgi:hypothetical protein